MTREELEKFALSLGGVHCGCPFRDDFTTLVMRHADSGKWFGIYMPAPVKSLIKGAGQEKAAALSDFFNGAKRAFVVCLKCQPELSAVLQQNYVGVLPAYHMNKRLWISVILGCDVDRGTVEKLITLSYDITNVRARREKERM